MGASMIVGGPAGHLVGDPVDTGSLTRIKYTSLGSSGVTFGAAAGKYAGTSFKTAIKDLTTIFLNAASVLNVPNANGNPCARYIYNDLYITVPMLADPSGALLLNKITSDVTSSLANTLGSFFPRSFSSSAVGVQKGRFDLGKLRNGN